MGRGSTAKALGSATANEIRELASMVINEKQYSLGKEIQTIADTVEAVETENASLGELSKTIQGSTKVIAALKDQGKANEADELMAMLLGVASTYNLPTPFRR